jgi:hypothetical protein
MLWEALCASKSTSKTEKRKGAFREGYTSNVFQEYEASTSIALQA